jgi:hypothetical protein
MPPHTDVSENVAHPSSEQKTNEVYGPPITPRTVMRSVSQMNKNVGITGMKKNSALISRRDKNH